METLYPVLPLTATVPQDNPGAPALPLKSRPGDESREAWPPCFGPMHPSTPYSIPTPQPQSWQFRSHVRHHDDSTGMPAPRISTPPANGRKSVQKEMRLTGTVPTAFPRSQARTVPSVLAHVPSARSDRDLASD